jgi:broad specificity phosphatase PhoE
MKDQSTLKQRYLRDALPVRLGGLAANLARIKSFSDHSQHGDVIERLIEESKFFIEWTAVDAELSVQAELVELQRQLARWQHDWQTLWANPESRADVAERSNAWPQRVLEMSGLLHQRT